MIGKHQALVYPDPNAGGFVPTGVYNGEFDAGADGWQPMPFTAAITVPSPGQLRQTTTGANQAVGIGATPVRVGARIDTSVLRVTWRIKLGRGAYLRYGVNFGDTQTNATLGEFWAGLDHAAFLWAGAWLDAGTHTLSVDVDPTEVNPAFVWMTPGIAVNYMSGAAAVDYYGVALDYLTGDALDISCLVDQIAINHGRQDATAQPEASTATLDLDLTADSLPVGVDIGSVIHVTTELDNGASSVRFHGRVTDINLGWDDAGELTPFARMGQLTAASMLADLGRRVVGDAPFPQELDGARVARVLALAGLDTDPITSDPGIMQVIATDIDRRDALTIADDTAQSASGILWQTRAGSVRYADAEHRRGITSTLTLDSCQILVTPTWQRTLTGMVNTATIGYGVAPEGGTAPTVQGESLSSVARYGEYGYSLTTLLAREADALNMLGLVLARNSLPVWVMADLPVDVEGLESELTDALLSLDMHSLITLTGLPVVAPDAPTSAVLWVEGWQERLAWGVHELELAVSGYCRTSPPPRWDDVSQAWLWDAMGDLTWDQAACFGPPLETGRWADVPASTRWDNVPPATTWDTWIGV